MSHHNSKKSTKKSTKRKCSVCRNTGHTKRTCGKNKSAVSVVKKRVVSTDIATKNSTQSGTPVAKKKNTFVFVNAHSKAPESPHVVNLKNDSNKQVWENVSAFKEETKERVRRVSINFGDLIREHKARKKTPHPNIEEFRTALKKIEHGETVLDIKSLNKKKKISFSRLRISDTVSSVFGAVSAGIQKIKQSVSNAGAGVVLHIQQKRVATVIALVVLMVLPFPARGYYTQISNDSAFIVQRSTDAFLSLQSSTVAALSNNIAQAQFDLSEALHAFSDAKSLIDKEYHALTYVAGLLPVVGKKIESRQDILVAGHHIALANTYLVKGIDEATRESEMKNTERLFVLKTHLRSALPQYKEALVNIASLDTKALPAEYQSSFDEFRLLYSAFINDLEDLVGVIDALEIALGTDDFRRYLVMFQNNHEIRATGGFTGSYAILDVQKGKILNVTVPGGGTYDVQGQLDVHVRPPLPLQLANKRWEFQDVNWFPHYPATARKTMEFYRHARGTTVDGVISVNASVLSRLLSVVGPVYNDEFGLALEGEDALTNLQRHVEVEYDKTKNEPKAVLASVLDQMMKLVSDVEPQRLVQLLVEANEALQQKEIQVYFEDARVQNKFRSFGWTGEIAGTEPFQDYLMVINTNIGGQKSDARVEQHIEHQAVIEQDGTIVNTVIIRREHVGDTSELFYGNKNINYVRLYVPHGAELLDAGGFSFPEEESFMVPEYWYEDDADIAAITASETIDVHTGTQIAKDQGKTVFANWVVTDPGEASEVYFTYKLPFTIYDIVEQKNKDPRAIDSLIERINAKDNSAVSRYSLFAQKQSGVNGDLVSQVIFPEGWRPVWRTDERVQASLNGASYKNTFEKDSTYGIVMEYRAP